MYKMELLQSPPRVPRKHPRAPYKYILIFALRYTMKFKSNLFLLTFLISMLIAFQKIEEREVPLSLVLNLIRDD